MRYFVTNNGDGTFTGTCDDFEYINDAIADSFAEALELIQDYVERAQDETESSVDWY